MRATPEQLAQDLQMAGLDQMPLLVNALVKELIAQGWSKAVPAVPTLPIVNYAAVSAYLKAFEASDNIPEALRAAWPHLVRDTVAALPSEIPELTNYVKILGMSVHRNALVQVLTGPQP